MQQGQRREATRDRHEDAALFDQYGQAVFAYARLHTPSFEDAEDITLDVFIAALEHDNLTALPASERLAWLRRVAHNKLVDTYRKRVQHPSVGLNTVAAMVYEDDMQAPEHVAIKHELLRQLATAIGTLPELQQQLLRLRFDNELRFSEIAVLLGKREDAMRKLFSRTLALLRKMCHQQSEEEGTSC